MAFAAITLALVPGAGAARHVGGAATQGQATATASHRAVVAVNDGGEFLVGTIKLRYAQAIPRQPPVADLLAAPIKLAQLPTGLATPWATLRGGKRILRPGATVLHTNIARLNASGSGTVTNGFVIGGQNTLKAIINNTEDGTYGNPSPLDYGTAFGVGGTVSVAGLSVPSGGTTPPPVIFIPPPTIQPPPTITPPPGETASMPPSGISVGGALTSIGNTGAQFGAQFGAGGGTGANGDRTLGINPNVPPSSTASPGTGSNGWLDQLRIDWGNLGFSSSWTSTSGAISSSVSDDPSGNGSSDVVISLGGSQLLTSQPGEPDTGLLVGFTQASLQELCRSVFQQMSSNGINVGNAHIVGIVTTGEMISVNQLDQGIAIVSAGSTPLPTSLSDAVSSLASQGVGIDSTQIFTAEVNTLANSFNATINLAKSDLSQVYKADLPDDVVILPPGDSLELVVTGVSYTKTSPGGVSVFVPVTIDDHWVSPSPTAETKIRLTESIIINLPQDAVGGN